MIFVSYINQITHNDSIINIITAVSACAVAVIRSHIVGGISGTYVFRT
jgi:hypothetical protein